MLKYDVYFLVKVYIVYLLLVYQAQGVMVGYKDYVMGYVDYVMLGRFCVQEIYLGKYT